MLGDDAPPLRRHFDMRELWRVGLWGMAASVALLLAMFAASTDLGNQRLTVVLAQVNGTAQPKPVQIARPVEPRDDKRLADTVRMLASDRERLLARISKLESDMDDMTGSIARSAQPAPVAAPANAPAEPPAVAAAPPSAPGPTVEPPPSAPPSVPPTQPVPVQPPMPMATVVPPAAPIAPPAPASVWVPVPRAAPTFAAPALPAPAPAVATEPAKDSPVGLDLGGGASLDALRALWMAARTRHGTLIGKLQPLVGVRSQGGEMRLIVGPVANAEAAARLCAVLTTNGVQCQPAAFVGQRLAAVVR
jgi:hypothetical protein